MQQWQKTYTMSCKFSTTNSAVFSTTMRQLRMGPSGVSLDFFIYLLDEY